MGKDNCVGKDFFWGIDLKRDFKFEGRIVW